MNPTVKDMAITPQEFLRSVPIALRGHDYRVVDGRRVEAGTEERGLTISFEPLPPRLLGGLISMPRCEVTIAFQGLERDEMMAFLQHFDQVYRRGGG